MDITHIPKRVSDVYANKFGIKRDDDWFILKIQEELGELTAAHLKLTQRARIGGRGIKTEVLAAYSAKPGRFFIRSSSIETPDTFRIK